MIINLFVFFIFFFILCKLDKDVLLEVTSALRYFVDIKIKQRQKIKRRKKIKEETQLSRRLKKVKGESD